MENFWKEADDNERSALRPKAGGGASDFISHIFRDSTGELARQWTLARIQSRWPSMAGNLAKHSWPDRITGRRLVVRVTHDVYSQEFFLFRADIVQRLRQSGVAEIDEIQVEKGRVRFSRVSQESATPLPESVNDEGAVGPEMKEFLDKLKNI